MQLQNKNYANGQEPWRSIHRHRPGNQQRQQRGSHLQNLLIVESRARASEHGNRHGSDPANAPLAGGSAVISCQAPFVGNDGVTVVQNTITGTVIVPPAPDEPGGSMDFT